MERNKGYCITANMQTGKNAAKYVKVEVHLCFSSLILIRIVAPKDTIVVAMEKNRKEKPAVSFLGRDFRIPPSPPRTSAYKA